ncbi:MAG: TonB-dependent receptor [Bacteroidales bacterium]|nr:TonB-dependent receptor [Bacteroidales bacterium]MBN2699096.1 TonB-dependent receptor [Bacteroidales bacterium]
MERNKLNRGPGTHYFNLNRWVEMFKLSALLILCSQFQLLIASDYSETQLISLHVKDTAIHEILEEIERRSEFHFFYNHEVLAHCQQKASIDIDNGTIYEILDQLFASQPVSYSVIDRHIIITPNKTKKPEESLNLILQQQIQVSGTVTDAQSGDPLPGVNVVIEGTVQGTATDISGYYSIRAQPNSVLVFSFVGYQDETIEVNGRTRIDVVLQQSYTVLEEIIAIGYGSQRKETITGAISSISSEDIVKQPASNVTQTLAGQLPGLMANQPGNRPGKDISTLKIRGIGTLDAGAGSDPLIMIDGIAHNISDLFFLDPNEIETLSILKDASATAVYGVRGANGVILVTTKRGKTGPVKITYSANVALIQPTIDMGLLDSYVQTGMANEYKGFSANTTNPAAPFQQDVRERFKGVIEGNPLYPTDPFFYPSTDYEDAMMKDFTMQHQHNFNISGGTERLRYFGSLGYYKQGGLFKNINPNLDKTTDYNRYNYRANMDIDVTNSTLVEINIGGTDNQNVNLGDYSYEPSFKYYTSLFAFSPPWSSYIYDGKPVVLTDPSANPILIQSGMRGYSEEFQNTAEYTVVVNQDLKFLAEGLSLKGKASLATYYRNLVIRDKDQRNTPTWVPQLNEDSTVSFYQIREDILPRNYTSQNKNKKEYYELSLNYNRKFNNQHNVGALVLGYAEKSHFSESYFNSIPRSYMGVVGRVTYNYMNRYLAEYNAGFNGSENFAEGNRFGFFPAYSFGWSFTEEPWFRNLINEQILTYGKFRFSYGKVGNDRIGRRFLYLPDVYYLNTTILHPYFENRIQFGPPGYTAVYPIAQQGAAGNPNVTWEKSTKINYGAELSFLKGNLKATFDYFTENRIDILIDQRVVPVYQQTGQIALNLGQVRNKGYEAELSWNSAINENSRVMAKVNYSFARNKIIEMDEPEQLYEYRMQTGRRVGEIWGYLQEDFFKTEEEANAYRDELWEVYLKNNPGADKSGYQAYQIFTSGHDVGAGDLKFIDRNNDGLINSLDEGYIGKVNFPESMFAFNFSYNYKALSVSFILQGATNFATNIHVSTNFEPSISSLMQYVSERYTPERYAAGEPVNYPRFLETNNNWQYYHGTFWIRDASYLRIKNFQLGYSFSKSAGILNQLNIDNIELYVNGYDLYAFTALKNIDPETRNGELLYPRTRTFNIGVKAQF